MRAELSIDDITRNLSVQSIINHSLRVIEVNPVHAIRQQPANNISAFDIIPNLFYPYLLAVSSLFFIAVDGKKKGS